MGDSADWSSFDYSNFQTPVDLQAPAGGDTWDSSSLFANTDFTTPTDSGTTTLAGGMANLTGAFSNVLSGAKDILSMKTSYDQMQLANKQLNLNSTLANNQAMAQQTMAQAQLGIAQANVKRAEVMANEQLGIAQAQAGATLAAVQANPLSSQFVTGHGILGNLTADGKISLIIGLVTIWMMMKHKKAA